MQRKLNFASCFQARILLIIGRPFPPVLLLGAIEEILSVLLSDLL